jgi:hypothetical protein
LAGFFVPDRRHACQDPPSRRIDLTPLHCFGTKSGGNCALAQFFFFNFPDWFWRFPRSVMRSSIAETQHWQQHQMQRPSGLTASASTPSKQAQISKKYKRQLNQTKIKV